MHDLSLAIRIAALGVLLSLAVADLRERQLPTRIVLVFGAMYLAAAMLDATPMHDIGLHVAIAGASLFCAFALFAIGALGGGDAKLCAAIFLWSGPAQWLPTLALISLAGLPLALLGALTRRACPADASTPLRGLAMFSAARGVPYGVALAVGGVAAVLAGTPL